MHGTWVLSHFSCVWLFVTLWTVTHQALLSMGFSRQKCWSGLSCPPPGSSWPRDLLHWQASSLPLAPPGKPPCMVFCCCSSRWVVFPSLQPHGLQHTEVPCPSPSLRACLNSCPLSRWWHPTILSSVVPFSSCLRSCPASGSFLMNQPFASGGPKVLEFQFQHQSFSEYAELISFRIDWLDLLAVQGTLESLLQHRSSIASILCCSAFFMVQLSYSYVTTGKAIALTNLTFVGKVVSLLFNMVTIFYMNNTLNYFLVLVGS